MEENDISKVVEINSNHVKVIHLLLLFQFMTAGTNYIGFKIIFRVTQEFLSTLHLYVKSCQAHFIELRNSWVTLKIILKPM